MTDRGHPHTDQVLSRQIGENVAIGIVFSECRDILRKAELLEPTRDIRSHPKHDLLLNAAASNAWAMAAIPPEIPPEISWAHHLALRA